MSRKHKGTDSILFVPTQGALVTSGVLADDSWYKVKAKGVSSALPAHLIPQALFRTPAFSNNAITLAAGDEVYPMTLSEYCKVDVEISAEIGVIETTDSCDYPYNTSIPDGFTGLSGSINTMMRFDDETDELVDVTKDFLVKFYDIVEDDGEGTYTFRPKDDSDLLLMMLLNKDARGVDGKVENWFIVPFILNSASNNIALKDVFKADYGWTKGQGPAQVYTRKVVTSA